MRLESVEDLPDLWKETYDLVAQVPEGKVTTYGEVAKALGDVVASRFVGLAMSRNDDIVRVPCRRVVQSDGMIGGYTGGGPEKKITLLRHEGIRIRGTRILDFDKVLFTDFISNRPLRDLKARQLALRKRLSLGMLATDIRQVAGIDVAYEDDHAFASLVLFDYSSGEEVGRFTSEGDAKFPYVPTYLAFREIPVIRSLMRRVPGGTIVMFDGNGILHPEGFGVTSQIGVVFGVPTIGVAKKLLCGEVGKVSSDGVANVRLKGKTVGHAVFRGLGAKPVYVSAGHGLSPSQALEVTLKFAKRRVPEPTRVAHLAAEDARRRAKSK